MKRLNMLAAFELEINKLDDAVNKPVTDDSLYWLNQAVTKFIKERFNGNAPHYTSYEQNEKRTRDLHNLFESKKLMLNETIDHSTYTEYTYNYPKDLMYLLSERALIVDNNNEHPYDTSVFECTADSFMYRITNSLTDFHYKHHKARPLRVRTGRPDEYSTVSLLTDGEYKINSYDIYYLRVPEQITDEDPDDVDVEYKDFEDDVWQEIIKIAAQMYIENQSDARYNTLSREVLTQE